MLKRILILLFTLFAITMAGTAIAGQFETAPPIEEAQLEITSGRYTRVDRVDDYRALGYPGSRKIVRDSQDNLYVAYRKGYKREDEAHQRIFVARSTNNGKTWKVLNNNRPIESVGDYVQRVPSIAIGAADSLHVVWYGLDAETGGEADNRQIKYTRSLDGGQTWEAWRNLAVVPEYDGGRLWQEHPTIYIDGQNQLYIAWEGRDKWNTKPQVKFIKSSDNGATWSAWRNISESPTLGYSRPSIIATPAGKIVHVVAYGGNPEVAHIMWSRSQDRGETWSKWQAIAPGEQDQRHAAIAMDNQGRIHVVWRQMPEKRAENAKSQLYYAFFDGQEWGKAEQVAKRNSKNQFFPSLAIDAADRPWIVWSETASNAGFPKEDPTNGKIYVTAKLEERWHAPVLLSNSSRAIYPSLGLHTHGDSASLDVIWLENEGQHDRTIYYKTLDEGYLR